MDCYGHGKSSHNKEKYNIVRLGNDLIDFIKSKSDDKISILVIHPEASYPLYGFSSDVCGNLILEDSSVFKLRR